MDILLQIENMTEDEWQNYRIEQWNIKKNKQTSSDIPNWYLRNKSEYISFMSAQKEKSIQKGKPFNVDLEAIQKMSPIEWEQYREQSWAKKNKVYSSDIVPDWFLRTKTEYIEFLRSHTR
jgi:hypothetical protein